MTFYAWTEKEAVSVDRFYLYQKAAGHHDKFVSDREAIWFCNDSQVLQGLNNCIKELKVEQIGKGLSC